MFVLITIFLESEAVTVKLINTCFFVQTNDVIQQVKGIDYVTS